MNAKLSFRDEKPFHSTAAGKALIHQMVEGNERFIGDCPKHKHQDRKTLSQLTDHQDPEIVVVTCSDSRNDPATIFDMGIGDIFRIKTAGGIVLSEEQRATDASSIQLGSIEFMVSHWLKVKHPGLLLVLGHTNCGAVQAALNSRDDEAQASPHLQSLVSSVRNNLPEQVYADPGKDACNAVQCNSHAVLQSIIEHSEIVKSAIEQELLSYTTALFHLDAGRVEFPEELAA